jgi:hypothetical protein
METSHVQLTPEQRQALAARPGEPVHITDEETHKVYLLVEEGVVPTLDEEYIRQRLEVARDQIARGEVSTAPIDAVIAEAQRRHSRKP